MWLETTKTQIAEFYQNNPDMYSFITLTYDIEPASMADVGRDIVTFTTKVRRRCLEVAAIVNNHLEFNYLAVVGRDADGAGRLHIHMSTNLYSPLFNLHIGRTGELKKQDDIESPDPFIKELKRFWGKGNVHYAQCNPNNRPLPIDKPLPYNSIEKLTLYMQENVTGAINAEPASRCYTYSPRQHDANAIYKENLGRISLADVFYRVQNDIDKTASVDPYLDDQQIANPVEKKPENKPVYDGPITADNLYGDAVAPYDCIDNLDQITINKLDKDKDCVATATQMAEIIIPYLLAEQYYTVEEFTAKLNKSYRKYQYLMKDKTKEEILEHVISHVVYSSWIKNISDDLLCALPNRVSSEDCAKLRELYKRLNTYSDSAIKEYINFTVRRLLDMPGEYYTGGAFMFGKQVEHIVWYINPNPFMSSQDWSQDEPLLYNKKHYREYMPTPDPYNKLQAKGA